MSPFIPQSLYMPEWNRVYEENKMKKTFIVTDEFLGN